MALFEGLSEKLGAIIKSLRSSGRITENDIKNISREIRLALLSADVNYKIVKDFVSVISEKALIRMYWKALHRDNRLSR